MKLSQEQWLANLKLALTYWKATPPSKVVEDLEYYSSPAPDGCGSVACFGGHLATWKPFKDMGITRVEETGAPIMRHDVGVAVSEYLFGVRSLFYCRNHDDPLDMTDHEVVTWRLERRIAHLESQVTPKKKARVVRYRVTGHVHGVPCRALYKSLASAKKFSESIAESEVYDMVKMTYVYGSSKFVQTFIKGDSK